MSKKIKPGDLRPYDPAHWTLIPLHRPNDTSTTKQGRERKDGKRPLDKNWTTKNYSTRETIKRAIADNRNTGVRLKADQLVIDVDPRNGGTEGFANLCLDLGLDETKFPRVVTGSGGDHYYMSKPADVPVVDTLEGYAGVEFKSKGRQVVAAGSLHPDTGDYYEWAEGAPSVEELPKIPRALLNLIKRPARDSVTTGGGQYTQEQIAKALDSLDVTEFNSNDPWFKLMCACHHASNGDARSEWIEWSTSDPAFGDDAEMIGRRWDSLHKDKPEGITFRTLNKILSDHNATHAQAKGDATGDFDAIKDDESEDASWLEGDGKPNDTESEEEDDEEKLSPLEELNAKYWWVLEGGTPNIIYRDHDRVLKRDYWVRMSPSNFALHHCNRKIERVKDTERSPTTIPLGKAWIEWRNRRQAEAVLFDPEIEHPGCLNLWTGFAFDPSPKGEWTYLNEMIFEVLSDGNDKVHAYILDWLRFMFQHPASPAEVALVFRGGRGVGKTTLGEVIGKLIGRHAMTVHSSELVTGRFNDHLRDLLFLFADEAIKPYDHVAESRLKGLITSDLLAFEGKGLPIVQAANLIHIMMASNEKWVIPAGLDERRFLVSDANSKWKDQFAKWTALRQQLERDGNSGYKRLLFDLLKTPFSVDRFHPRAFIPTTNALIDQKIRSLTPLQQFFFNSLNDGNLPFAYRLGPWEKESIRFFVEDLRSEFQSWCKANQINPGGMGRGNTRFLLQEIKQVFPGARTELRDSVDTASDTVRASPSDGRAQSIELPALQACRLDFERSLNGPVDWAAVADDFG